MVLVKLKNPKEHDHIHKLTEDQFVEWVYRVLEKAEEEPFTLEDAILYAKFNGYEVERTQS